MKKLLFSIILLCFFTTNSTAQSCFNISAGPDIFTSCLTLCSDIKVKVPDIRTSETYKVIAIPYTPYPYVTAAPAFVHPCSADQDDKFADVATLPFNFCFFGSVYTEYVLGTNGVITFDKSNALTGNNYEVSTPLPNVGTGTADYACPAPPFPDGELYPKFSIMGLYHDVFPEVGDGYKIEARIEGSSPCRKFVMSYSNVKIYNCPSLTSTFQVVLHEGTGLIDIYIEKKPECGGVNAIIGIQKEGVIGKPFAAPPGRNLFTQEINREAWRFVPNGTTSLLSRVEIYKNNVLVPITPAIVDLGTGELEATFPNLCQTEDSMSYVVKAFYKQCDNPAIETEGSDTIIVKKTLNPVNITPSATQCPTSSDGKLTVTSPLDPTIEYSIDGVTWQTSTIFTGLLPQTYTVTARVIGSTCTGTGTATIPAGPVPFVITNVTPPNCPGTITGTINVTVPVASIDVEYSIDGGTTWQASPVFTVAAGTYIIKGKVISSNCIGTSPPITVTDPTPITITTTEKNVACNGTATGVITVTAPLGADFEYSINGGANWQSSPVFNVTAFAYTLSVRQISINCITTKPVTITQPAILTASAIATKQASCANNDGEITITASGGTTPYQYSLNNGSTYQASNIFINLDTATYNKLKVKDANDCEFFINAIVVTLNDTMHLALGPDTTICADKTVVLTATTNPQTNIFLWTLNPNNGSLSTTIAANPIASPADTTKYTLEATFGICKRTDDIIVNVLRKPIADAGKDTTICINTPAFISGSASNLSGLAYYSWSPETKLTYTSTDSSRATVNPDTTQKYAFVIKDSYGCNFTITDTMTVFTQPPIIPFAGNDTIAMVNKPHQLKASGGVKYLWSPSGPLDHNDIYNPKAIMSSDTYFTVLITDAIGCTATSSIFIKVYQGPTYYAPNAFTPNGDGTNDIFRVIPPGIKTTNYFRVFNRYGQIIFETNQYMKGWDGTYKGKPQPADTYVWSVRGVDEFGHIIEDRGTVILLR